MVLQVPEQKRSQLNLKQYGMMIALVVIFLLFSMQAGGKNASAMNINNLVMQNRYVVILAIGMLLCIITGNVDLSVVSVVAFTGAVCLRRNGYHHRSCCRCVDYGRVE